MIYGREKEVEAICQCTNNGMFWVEGIHGIGKTTLIRESLNRIETDGIFTKYIDLRVKSQLYVSPEACLLSEITGQDVSTYSKPGVFRKLSDIILDPNQIQRFIVIDELDLYTPTELNPLRNLLEATAQHNIRLFKSGYVCIPELGASPCKLTICFISAQSRESFLIKTASSTTYYSISKWICPLEHSSITDLINSKGVFGAEADYLANLTGGNPGFTELLLDKFNSKENISVKQLISLPETRQSIDNYFASVWQGLERNKRAWLVLAALYFGALMSKTKNEKFRPKCHVELGWRLDGLIPFAKIFKDEHDLGAKIMGENIKKCGLPFAFPVSPLFHTWVFNNQANPVNETLLSSTCSDVGNDVYEVLGLEIADWRDLASTLTVVSKAGDIVTKLCEVAGGLLC